MSRCDIHDEVFKNLNETLSDLKDTSKKIVVFMARYEEKQKNVESNLKKHENNAMIHISKWWVAGTIIASIVAVIAGVKI